MNIEDQEAYSLKQRKLRLMRIGLSGTGVAGSLMALQLLFWQESSLIFGIVIAVALTSGVIMLVAANLKTRQKTLAGPIEEKPFVVSWYNRETKQTKKIQVNAPNPRIAQERAEKEFEQQTGGPVFGDFGVVDHTIQENGKR